MRSWKLFIKLSEKPFSLTRNVPRRPPLSLWGRGGERGFTLIEMLIVVVVLGIIISIAVPALNYAKEQSRINAAKANAKALNEAYIRASLDGVVDSSYMVFSATSSPSGHSLQDRMDCFNWLLNKGYIRKELASKVRVEDLRLNVTASHPNGGDPPFGPWEWVSYDEVEAIFPPP
jgi:prepilin-type N-terminal cleavage/methylation domain-containing protein